MEIVSKVSVDLVRQGEIPVVDVVQGDSARTLEITLMNDGAPYPLPSGAEVVIRFSKADGTGGTYDSLEDGTVAWSAAENVLTVALAEQVCTAVGPAFLQLIIIKELKQITTFRIMIRVSDEAAGGDGSEHYVNLTKWLTRTPVIDEILQRLDDLEYVPIEITKFESSLYEAEIGGTVDEVTLSWEFNQRAKDASLDGVQLLDEELVSGERRMPGLGLRANRTWVLKAFDRRLLLQEKTVTLKFLNRIYWGVAEKPTSVNNDFVRNLENNPLSEDKTRSFTVNAGAGQYIWYCIPERLGQCTFESGGFFGGFYPVKTLRVINKTGYQENYVVYRSDNAGLGETTVNVY